MATAWGTVNADGKPINYGSQNWSVLRENTGLYLVTLKGLVAPNIVIVASGYRRTAEEDEAAQDNTYSTRVLTPESFEVYSYDTGQEERGKRQDAAFSFIAMWGL